MSSYFHNFLQENRGQFNFLLEYPLEFFHSYTIYTCSGIFISLNLYSYQISDLLHIFFSHSFEHLLSQSLFYQYLSKSSILQYHTLRVSILFSSNFSKIQVSYPHTEIDTPNNWLYTYVSFPYIQDCEPNQNHNLQNNYTIFDTHLKGGLRRSLEILWKQVIK